MQCSCQENKNYKTHESVSLCIGTANTDHSHVILLLIIVSVVVGGGGGGSVNGGECAAVYGKKLAIPRASRRKVLWLSVLLGF